MSQSADCDFEEIAVELQTVGILVDHAEFSDNDRAYIQMCNLILINLNTNTYYGTNYVSVCL